MESLFDKTMGRIPSEVKSKDDVVLWLLENGIYVHKDDKDIPFNSLCNHMDQVIMDADETSKHGRPASYFWITQAARNKIFGYLSKARAIQAGHPFTLVLGRTNEENIL